MNVFSTNLWIMVLLLPLFSSFIFFIVENDSTRRNILYKCLWKSSSNNFFHEHHQKDDGHNDTKPVDARDSTFHSWLLLFGAANPYVIKSFAGGVYLIVYYVLVLIIISSLTASITSYLTAQVEINESLFFYFSHSFHYNELSMQIK